MSAAKESFLLKSSKTDPLPVSSSAENVESIEGGTAEETQDNRRPNKCWTCLTVDFVDQLKQQSFMVGVFIAVGFAAAVPNLGAEKGPLRTEYSVKYGIVPFIFFIMGIALKTKDLAKALKDMKLNLTIQFMSLIFIPSFVYGIYIALQNSNMNPALLRGLVVLACVPVTTTTCNVLCKAADGNTAVSLFHSALGNLLGAFYTPSVLLLLLGNQSTVSFLDVLTKILETLLAPLVAGQIIHNCFGNNKYVQWVMKKSGDVTKICLLIIIWNTFCDTFNRKIENVETLDVVYIILIVVAFHVFFVVTAIILYKQKCFSYLNRRTQVSAWFCSTQKTIVMGIPLIKIIFEGNPEIGLIQIPLLMYHPTQTIGASFFLGKINRWVKKDDEAVEDETAGLLNGKDYGGTYSVLPPDDVSLDLGQSAVVSASQHSLISESDSSIPPSPSTGTPGGKDRPRIH